MPTSPAIHVAGLCTIKTDVGGSLDTLGLSVNGVDISIQDFMEKVPGDEFGGDAGPPIDVLKHGDIHIISMELTKWDDTVIGLLDTRNKSGTAGQVSSGFLYRAGSKMIRLLLTAPSFTRNYLACIPVGPLDLTRVGNRYSTKRLTFEAHAVKQTVGESDVYVMWNQTTT